MRIKDTTEDIKWLCPKNGDKLPDGDKVICLSKFGVVSAGKYIEGFHIGYVPLPKIDKDIRRLLAV